MTSLRENVKSGLLQMNARACRTAFRSATLKWMPRPTPVALTIAGSDPSGGPGIQAELKTFHQFGVYGEAVGSLITVQNTCGVERVEYLSADLVTAQIRAVIGDIPPAAAKTGALGK